MRSNVRKWTYVLFVNTSYSPPVSFCTTGDRCSLVTRWHWTKSRGKIWKNKVRGRISSGYISALQRDYRLCWVLSGTSYILLCLWTMNFTDCFLCRRAVMQVELVSSTKGSAFQSCITRDLYHVELGLNLGRHVITSLNYFTGFISTFKWRKRVGKAVTYDLHLQAFRLGRETGNLELWCRLLQFCNWN